MCLLQVSSIVRNFAWGLLTGVHHISTWVSATVFSGSLFSLFNNLYLYCYKTAVKGFVLCCDREIWPLNHRCERNKPTYIGWIEICVAYEICVVLSSSKCFRDIKKWCISAHISLKSDISSLIHAIIHHHPLCGLNIVHCLLWWHPSQHLQRI